MANIPKKTYKAFVNSGTAASLSGLTSGSYVLTSKGEKVDLKDIVPNQNIMYDHLLGKSCNILNGYEYGYYTGVNTYNDSTEYVCSNPIFVKAGVEYKYKFADKTFGTNTNVYVYDEQSKSVVSRLTGNVTDGYLTFTSPVYAYVVVNIGPKSVAEDFVICESSLYSEDNVGRELLNVCVDAKKIVGEVQERNLNAGLIAASKVAQIGVNLFDKTSSDILADTYIAYDTYNKGNGYFVSHPIAVKKNTEYKFPFKKSLYGNNYRFAYLQADFSIASTHEASISEDGLFLSFVSNSDGYVRVNCGKADDIQQFMFCVSSDYPNSYTDDFGLKLTNDVRLNEKQKEEISSFAERNPLYGKIISFNGDSICYGAGYKGGYGKIIADRNNMTCQNIAVGGATIAAETYYADGSPRHWISRTISRMREDADYVILEGGVNDSVNSNIGSITDDYTAYDSLDDTSFTGAFEKMIQDVYSRFPGKKVGYIAVHKMTRSFDSQGNSENRYNLAKKICEKWGFPFLDLNISCPPFGLLNTYTAIGSQLRSLYTKDGDGWHPNQDGYNKFYVPKIEAWLKTL